MRQKETMSTFFPLILLILLPLVSAHYFEESKYRLERVSNELESVTFKLNEGCYDHQNELEHENHQQHRHHHHHSRLCRNSAYSSTMQLLREISFVNIQLEIWRNHSACLSYEEEPMVENLIMSFTQGCLDYMGKLNGSQLLSQDENTNNNNNNSNTSISISSTSGSVETMDKNRRAELRKLKSEYERHLYSASRVRHLLVNEPALQKIAEKIRFCEAVETNGGIFIGYDQPEKEEYVMEVIRGRKSRGSIIYVLFLKDFSLVDGGPCNRNWKENRDVWFHELKTRRQSNQSSSSSSSLKLMENHLLSAEFYAIDCSFKMDLCNESLVLPVIHQYENGKLLQKNYAEYHRNQIKSTLGQSPSSAPSGLNLDEALGFSGARGRGQGQRQGATALAHTSQDGKKNGENGSGSSTLKNENGLMNFFTLVLILHFFYSIL